VSASHVHVSNKPHLLENLLIFDNIRVSAVTSEAGYHSVDDECSVNLLRGSDYDHVRLGSYGNIYGEE
jgi:hypothetical protein